MANRLPVDLETLPDGSSRWKRSPGGLVTALEPILRSNKGAWVGWPGVPDAAPDPITQDGVELHSVPLSAQEITDYYEGFSNATLWPLYHDVIVKPVYDRTWWSAYVEVNRKFTEAAAKIAADGATVWIQDYQLQLVPKMLRMLRPDLRIGFFLHTPWPTRQLLVTLPHHRRLVESMFDFDLIGFHTREWMDLFTDYVVTEARGEDGRRAAADEGFIITPRRPSGQGGVNMRQELAFPAGPFHQRLDVVHW